jgi:arylsulfatase A-like enzyme
MFAGRHFALRAMALCAALAYTAPVIAAEGRPNVIVVLVDDMGWADLSCFGNRAVKTENLDRLAREGLRFSQFYVNAPICSPSRTALTTGCYPQRFRIGSYLAHRELNRARGIADWLDLDTPTLARILHDAGYATGHFGKWHMGGQRDVGEAPLIGEYGFDASLTNFEGLGDRVLPLLDAFDGQPPRPHALGSDQLGRGSIQWIRRDQVTAAYVAAAIAFIDAAVERSEPCYLNVWPDDVHSPFFPPETKRGDGSKRARFHGALDAMDEQLGALFDHIRDSDALRENTLILVCSDNGPEPGAGSAGEFRGKKAGLYEGGVRSPLVVWAPRMMDATAVGTWNRESVVAAFDVAPSILAIVGVAPPTGVEFDGQDMHEELLGVSSATRATPLFFRRPPDRGKLPRGGDAPDLAVRSGDWKLLCEYDGSRAQLFDLANDPGEQVDLATEHPEVAAELTEQVVAWHASLPADNGAAFVEEGVAP